MSARARVPWRHRSPAERQATGDRAAARRVIELGYPAVCAGLLTRDPAVTAIDPRSAVRGAVSLVEADRLDEADAAVLVSALWFMAKPRPSRSVDPATWRLLFDVAGPVYNGGRWPGYADVPDVLWRAASDADSARGWSWTADVAVARWHAEGRTLTSRGRTHEHPRIWSAHVPADAVLAALPLGQEQEFVIDPDGLDAVHEVPVDEWATWPAPRIVRAPGAGDFYAPATAYFARFPDAPADAASAWAKRVSSPRTSRRETRHGETA